MFQKGSKEFSETLKPRKKIARLVGFQDQCHKPLDHLSSLRDISDIRPDSLKESPADDSFLYFSCWVWPEARGTCPNRNRPGLLR